MAEDKPERPRGWIRKNRPIPPDLTRLPDGSPVHFEPDIDPELQYACDLYGNDPYGFVLNMFDWGRPYSLLRNRERPYDWQCDVLADMSARLKVDASIYRLGLASGKGIGKTALQAMVGLWHLMTHRYSQTNLLSVTGDSIDQRVWAEIGRWFHVCKLRPYFRRYRGGRIVNNYHDDWSMQYQLWSLSHLEALHGSHAEHLAYLIDECTGVPDEVLQTVESGAVDDHVVLCYFSNPTRLRSRFRQYFPEGTLCARWRTWQIDSRTTERCNAARVQELLDEVGGDEEDPQFRINVRGLFPVTDSEQFISTAIVEAAQQRVPSINQDGSVCIGVDVARKGENKSVFYMRHGWKTLEKKVFSKLEIDETATALMDFMDTHKARKPQAYIDIVGYGAGVYAICKRFGYDVHEVNSALPALGPHKERFENRRMELWDFVKSWLREGGCLDPKDSILARQLVAPSAFVNTRGLLQLESKEQLESRGVESPDEADALTYSFGGYQAYKRAGTWGRGN
jgi:hypothetical protein